MIDPLSMNSSLKYTSIENISTCRIHGRNKIVNNKLPLFFNRSGVEITVSGTELWVDVEVGFSVFEPWIVLEINGAFIMRQMLLPGEYSVCLFRGMSYKDEKRIFIFRDLQAMSDDAECHLAIKGFYSDGKYGAIPKRDCRLEFVGDSITSGEGTYGDIYDMDWLPMYMGYSRTYAAIIEKELNAEVRIISQGGWGVYCGWDNDTSHNIPSIYGKVCGFSKGEFNTSMGAQDDYDPGDWQPDAVIINLGTNDLSGFDQPPFYDPVSKEFKKLSRNSDGKLKTEDTEKIEKAVRSFLGQVRALYPDAYILWIYGMLKDELAPYLSRAVLQYSGENDDKKAGFLSLPDTAPGEFGSREHPGFKSHQKAAAVIIQHLKKIIL